MRLDSYIIVAACTWWGLLWGPPRFPAWSTSIGNLVVVVDSNKLQHLQHHFTQFEFTHLKPSQPSLLQLIQPNMASAPLPSANLLLKQLKEMQSDKDLSNISVGLVDDNIYEWEVMLMISDDCKFYAGRPPFRSSRLRRGIYT